MTIHVHFICLGNICRSPMAEGIFQHLVDQAGLTNEIRVDSAGTGRWHIGEQAHPGTRQILKQHGITYHGRARQVNRSDKDVAYLIAMDENNLQELERLYGRQKNQHLLLDFAQNSQQRSVPDPYYTGNFNVVYELVLNGCQGLLETIQRENGL